MPHPYIRPREMGSTEREYTVKIVTDGTRTIAEVYEGDEEQVRLWGGAPIGVGHSVRRKGDRRDNGVGATLALARAFADASANAFESVSGALDG